MTRDEIMAKAIALAAEQAGVKPDEISPATHFVNDLNFDSLDQVEYAMEIEDQFHVTVPDQDVEKLQTIEAVVDYLVRQGEVSPAASG